MTSFALNSLLKDPTTDVEVNYSDQTAVVQDQSKQKIKYYVSKSLDSTPFFSVTTDRSVPLELRGHYSSVNNAIQAICTYLKNSSVSTAKYADEMEIVRKERNAAKSQPKGSKLV